MINAIQKIGEYVVGKQVNRKSFLENICLYIEPEREKRKQHIVFINFNIKDQKVEFDFEEINAKGIETGKYYFWIGDTIRHKLYCPITTTKIENLLGKTTSDLDDNVGIDHDKYQEIKDNFFHDGIIDSRKLEFFNGVIETIQFEIVKLTKYLYQITTEKDKKVLFKRLKDIWSKVSIRKFEISEKNTKEEISEFLISLQNNIADHLIERHKKIENVIEDLYKYKLKDFSYNKKLRTKSPDVSVYSLFQDGKPLSNNDLYKEFVYKEKIENLFIDKGKNKKYFKEKSVCSICSKCNVPTTSNVTNLTFKFYITDKLGFASNLDGHFKNNYNICKNCYQHLMIAERYIKEKFRSIIGGLNVYILPKFILSVDDFEIDEFAKFISFKNKQIADIRSAENVLEESLERFENFKNRYLINYLFYKSSGRSNEFKVLKLIKGIPPSRIEFIRHKEQEINNLVDDKFGGNRSIKIDLNRIWYCIPVKIERNKQGRIEKHQGYSKYLDVIDSIFSDRCIDYDFLINQAVETLNIIKYEREGTNIWNKKKNIKPNFVNKIINLNFLILFIQKLNILGGLKMDEQRKEHITDEMIPKEIFKYWENLEIYQDNQKKGLFLLGYLIGEVGNQQKVKDIKNKPILNKLNFQGMGTEKLSRLSSDILEKMRQFKLLEFNESIYSASHLLIEENFKNWSLSNQENVFYILSGFAFSNYLIRKRSKESYKKELEAKIQLIKIMKSKENNVKKFKKLLSEAKAKADEHKYYDARQILKEIKKS
ncbi:MAG: type I-B CRISPR-associated protein Cas8b/Csh1 [Promethearchaeota archaeon]